MTPKAATVEGMDDDFTAATEMKSASPIPFLPIFFSSSWRPCRVRTELQSSGEEWLHI